MLLIDNPNDEIDIPKIQIKNPDDINKYVQRGKKRGHAKKKSVVVGEMSQTKFKRFEITIGKTPSNEISLVLSLFS